jgi:hypothetical protein
MRRSQLGGPSRFCQFTHEHWCGHTITFLLYHLPVLTHWRPFLPFLWTHLCGEEVWA